MPQGSSHQRPEAVILRVCEVCTCCLGTWAGPQKCHLALAALRMTHTSTCSLASLQEHEAADVALHALPQGACVDTCISCSSALMQPGAAALQFATTLMLEDTTGRWLALGEQICMTPGQSSTHTCVADQAGQCSFLQHSTVMAAALHSHVVEAVEPYHPPVTARTDFCMLFLCQGAISNHSDLLHATAGCKGWPTPGGHPRSALCAQFLRRLPAEQAVLMVDYLTQLCCASILCCPRS